MLLPHCAHSPRGVVCLSASLQALAGVIGNLDSLLRASLVMLAAWRLMRGYTLQLLKMMGLPKETLRALGADLLDSFSYAF